MERAPDSQLPPLVSRASVASTSAGSQDGPAYAMTLDINYDVTRPQRQPEQRLLDDLNAVR